MYINMCIIPVKFQNMLICSFTSKLHVFAHKTHIMLFNFPINLAIGSGL